MRLVPAVLLAALAFAGQSSTPPVEMWFVDSLIKVFPDTSVPADKTIPEVLIARNGHASIQLALRSSAAVHAVEIKIHAAEPLRPEAFRVGFVPVKTHPKELPQSEMARPDLGEFPDPLLPLAGLKLEPGRTQPVWIKLSAGPDAKPGLYDVRLAVSAAGAAIPAAFKVRITPARVPQARSLKVTNWFYIDPDTARKQFPQVDGYNHDYWSLMANVGRVMAAHRQNTLLTPVRPLATPSIVDGKIVYDFARFDRWVETLMPTGVLDVIEGWHLLSRVNGYNTPTIIPVDLIEDGRIVQKQLPPEDPRAEQALGNFVTQVYRHLQEKGLTKRYIQHLHDEPHDAELPHYRRYARLVKSWMPGVPLIDAISLKEDQQFLKDTDIWVPLLGTFDSGVGDIEAHRKRGGQAWFYTAVLPQGAHLNRFIQQPLLKTRLLHWMNYRYGFNGYLHWGGNYWDGDAYQNVQPIINDVLLLPAGDSHLVYPDKERLSVASSIRLEAMLEGIEDYELLAQLGKTDSGRAQGLVKSAIPAFTDYVRDVQAFRKLQLQLYGAGE
jgi:hypothetical protein